MDYNRDGTVLVEKSLGKLEQYFLRFGTLPWADYNNNNNNNPICKAPECQKTSVALADRNSRAN